MKFNCKNCTNRHIGCHEHCTIYQRDKAQADKESHIRRMEGLYEHHAWTYQHTNYRRSK